MSEYDLESMLEDASWYKELSVRRYLSDMMDDLEEKLNERPDCAVGAVQFNPSDMGDKGLSTRYGRVAKFLTEDVGVVEEFTNYHIEPAEITRIKEEAENINLYPTVEEEKKLVKEILDEGELTISEITSKLGDRVNYNPSDKMVQQRLDKIDSVELKEKNYRLKRVK